MYKQCLLSKGTTKQVSWIPSKFAVVGKVLRLIDDDGWRVVSVGSFEMGPKQMRAMRERLHKGVFDSIK